jgi:hypothetical protein
MLMHLVVDRFSKAGSPNVLFFLVQYIHVIYYFASFCTKDWFQSLQYPGKKNELIKGILQETYKEWSNKS